MICEKVRNDLITSLKSNPASDLAALSCIRVLFRVEEREKVNFPSDPATLLNYILLCLKLHAIVVRLSMHLELLLSFKSATALWARHFERSFELDILVSVHLHLLGMVYAVLFLADLVLRCLSMLFKEVLAHEALNARATLVPPFRFHLVVRTERTCASILLRALVGLSGLSLGFLSRLLHDPVNHTFTVTAFCEWVILCSLGLTDDVEIVRARGLIRLLFRSPSLALVLVRFCL